MSGSEQSSQEGFDFESVISSGSVSEGFIWKYVVRWLRGFLFTRGQKPQNLFTV